MTSIFGAGTTYNWLQDVATTVTADWMSPSKGPSVMEQAADAFATAQQLRVSALNRIAVNTGIQTQQKKLATMVDYKV